MANTFNLYCDESCHLEHDGCNVMVLGAIGCTSDTRAKAFNRIRDIKKNHGFHPSWETKWTKVSSQKVAYYLDLVDYFFDNSDLQFRVVIIPDKAKLQHDKFNQSHDDFYYKMYFCMLKGILCPHTKNNIYLDIKDTQGGSKINPKKIISSYFMNVL